MPTEFRERWTCDEVTQGYLCIREAISPFPPVFVANDNFYLKMVYQNDFIILLIYSLKRTNSVLQEHEEALKKKKEMVLNKKQLARQGY